MIQWYPGHMAKAIREVSEKLKLVDLVIVLLDSRIPLSSYNPLLKETLKNKTTLYLLTKKDKADNMITNEWLEYYKTNNLSSTDVVKTTAIAIDARTSKDMKKVLKASEDLLKEKRAKDALKGLKPRPIRTMVVGIPNVGKSTLINSLVGKKAVVVGDKPGVTKFQQWIKINQNFELLDTPGILWPKFEDQRIGYHLAISGAIKDDILPINDVVLYLLDFLKKYYPNTIKERYAIDETLLSNEILEQIGQKHQYWLSTKEVDIDKTAKMIIQDFRNNSLGRITLDRQNYE